MRSSNLVTSLGAARVAVGVATYATPRLVGRALGIDPGRNPQAPLLARLFGARDAALGIGVLTSDGAARRQWVMISAGCDAADALAGIAGYRGGYLSKTTTALVTMAALGGVVLGAAALRDAG
jgi:hypothetical protein